LVIVSDNNDNEEDFSNVDEAKNHLTALLKFFKKDDVLEIRVKDNQTTSEIFEWIKTVPTKHVFDFSQITEAKKGALIGAGTSVAVVGVLSIVTTVGVAYGFIALPPLVIGTCCIPVVGWVVGGVCLMVLAGVGIGAYIGHRKKKGDNSEAQGIKGEYSKWFEDCT